MTVQFANSRCRQGGRLPLCASHVRERGSARPCMHRGDLAFAGKKHAPDQSRFMSERCLLLAEAAALVSPGLFGRGNRNTFRRLHRVNHLAE